MTDVPSTSANIACSPTALERLPRNTLGVPDFDHDPAWRPAAAYLLGFRGTHARPDGYRATLCGRPAESHTPHLV